MFCTNCGKQLNEGVNFCSSCGKEIKKDKPTYCTVCGSKLNPRNGICIRCAMSKKKEEVIVKPKKDTRNIKLNILLNLGVIMVLVAGFVMATTNWSLLSSWGKIGILIGLSVFFMIMHLLCEKRLKINVSAVIYFFLSLTFILFTCISLTYLQMFGHWFSLAGPGKFLCLASLALLFTLLTLIARLKYSKRWITLFTFIGVALTIFFICKYFGLGWLANLAIISLLMLLLYLYTANSVYKYITIVLSLIVFVFEGLFVNIIQPEYNIIAGTTLTVCNGLLLFIFGYLQKNKVIKVLSSITLFIFFMLFLNYSLMGSEWLVSISSGIVLLLLLMVLIINAINENNNKYDLFSRTSKICSICSISLLLLSYIGIHNSQFYLGYYFNPLTDILAYLINLTVVSFILVLCNIICLKEKTTIYKPIYAYLLPVSVIIFIINLARLVIKYVPGVTLSVCAMTFVIVFFILYLIQKKNILKIILHIILYVLLFITLFIYLVKGNLVIESIDGIAAILLPVISLILYFKEKKLDKYSLLYRWMSIIIFALSFINIVGTKDIFGFGSKISFIVTISSLVLIVLLFMDDMVIRRFIPFTIFLPLTSLISLYNLPLVYEIIILNIYSLLVLYLFAKTFSLKTYNILLIIGTIFILLQPTMYFNVTLSIYVSIVSILLIIYDLLSKNVKGLFTVGIVYLIINTIIELANVWSHISLWTYLLIAGIILIIITTILIAKNTNKKD